MQRLMAFAPPETARLSTLRVAHGTGKGALIHVTKQQATELGNAGIRVNAIAPGPVDTEMAKLVHSVALRADYHDLIPLNRNGTAAGSLHRRQVLVVDGGFDASGVGLLTLRKT